MAYEILQGNFIVATRQLQNVRELTLRGSPPTILYKLNVEPRFPQTLLKTRSPWNPRFLAQHIPLFKSGNKNGHTVKACSLKRNLSKLFKAFSADSKYGNC